MRDDQLRCPRCSTSMERGFLADLGDADATKVAQWIEGAPDVRWYGLKTSGRQKFPVTAYRCDRCGYLEFRALRDAES
ncbi:MAG: PF20097 family protein [Gemmatimonadaceae bacterium]|nr:PF20097 family protein [Gemmatimonadaceae bacterium]